MRLNSRLLLLVAAATYMLLAAWTDRGERSRIEALVEQHVQAAGRGAGSEEALTLTPPMGYNDWNAVHCNVSERLIERTARAMIG